MSANIDKQARDFQVLNADNATKAKFENAKRRFAAEYANASAKARKELTSALFDDAFALTKMKVNKMLATSRDITRPTSVMNSAIVQALSHFRNEPAGVEEFQEVQNLVAYLQKIANRVLIRKLVREKKNAGGVQRRIKDPETERERRIVEHVVDVVSIKAKADDNKKFDIPDKDASLTSASTFIEDLENAQLTKYATEFFADFPELTQDDQLLIAMRAEGYKRSEIADLFGVAPQDVTNRLAYIRRHLPPRV